MRSVDAKRPHASAAQYYRAFTKLAGNMSPRQSQMLGVHLSAKEQKMTMGELARAVNLRSYGAANLAYGRLGHMLGEVLRVKPHDMYYGENVWIDILAYQRHERTGEHVEWTLRPEVVAALRRIDLAARPRCFLILWRWPEAEAWEGDEPDATIGTHAKGVRTGDRLYICSTHGGEIYLLGVLVVEKPAEKASAEERRLHGERAYRADGRSAHGCFVLEPLRHLKWQLRFELTTSERLKRNSDLVWQIRARRRLTPASAEMLDMLLAERRKQEPIIRRLLGIEGKRMERVLSVRERDPQVRRQALLRLGYECTVCGVSLVERYGDFARDCVEVHHLNPLAHNRRRRATTIDDVIVVCPTCHRVPHRTENPAAWRWLRRQIEPTA
ncbi:MAG TPA: HNH endonuclease [Terriglobales bacterium]|nr:HNH endonuclease [Terriglobales bacterium]